MLSSVAFVGDSHVAYFRHAAEGGLLGKRQFAFCEVGGATAVGMRNPNSLTNALTTFSEFLKGVEKTCTVVIQLGEVDCGFVIWYRAEKYRESIDKQFKESVSA